MAKIVVYQTENWPYVDYCGVDEPLAGTTEQPREVEITDELFLAVAHAEADYAQAMGELLKLWQGGAKLKG